MPMIEIDAAERQQPQGLRPVGMPAGMVVTRDERSPPIRESAPVQSDMQGQDAPPTSGEMWGAAFRQSNEIASAAAAIGQPNEFGERDPDHNPWDTIAGTPLQQHWQSFVGSKNAAETEAIRARVQRELDDKDILARSGWAGVGASMVAGIASPTTLLPFGSVRTGFRGLTAAGRTAASTSAWAGAAVGLQEIGLQATQETRSAYESLLNIAGASIIGGALGAGASAFGSRRLAAASRAIDNDLRAIVREAKAIDEAERSAGAAAGAQVTRQVQENIVADALGVEKAFAFQSPMTRALASPITAVRDIVSRLAEIPFNLRQNELGIRTGPSIGSVESRIKVDGELALYRMQEQMINSFAAHRFENGGARAPLARDTFSAAVGTRPEGKLSWKEFKVEVTKALRSETTAGIEHPIPEVKAAAEAVRKNVFEPFKVEAQKLGLFAEDAEFATGYVMRKYDVDAILRERPKFEQILVDWLREGQGKARAELADLEAKLAGAEPADDLLSRARSAVDRYASDISELRAQVESVADTVRWLRYEAPKRPPQTLSQWVRAQGGIRDAPIQAKGLFGEEANTAGSYKGGEVANIAGGADVAGRLINNKSGKPLDDIALSAWENGFIRTQDRPTINQFLDALQEDINGNYVVRVADEEKLIEYQQAMSLANELEQMGIDVSGVKAARESAVSVFSGQMGKESRAGDQADLAVINERLKTAQGEERTALETAKQDIEARLADEDRVLKDIQEALSVPSSVAVMADRSLRSGRPVTVPAQRVQEVLAEIAPHAATFPAQTRAAAIEKIEPLPGTPEAVRLTVRTLDGASVTINVARRTALFTRAFHVMDPASGSLAVFTRLDRVSRGDEFVGGVVRHEAVHAQVRLGLLPVDSSLYRSLSDHAQSLRIMEMPAQDYMMAVRDPTALDSAPGTTLRKAYELLYRNRPNAAQLLEEEGIAHLRELYHHKALSPDDMARVAADIKALDDMGSRSAIAASVRDIEPKGGAAATAAKGADAGIDNEVVGLLGDLAKRYGIELPPGLADMSPDDLLKAAQKAIAGSEKADAKAGKAKAKADEATMARRDAIRHWADADEQELRAIASDVTNKIIGAPGGRTVNPYQTYDLPAGPRGPLQARTLTIPDEKIAEFLDDDIERIARAYVRTMAPDVALAREFGTIDFGDESPVMRQIADEVYRTNANTPQRAEEMSRAALVAKRDIQAMVARLRGTYNQGEDPLAWGPWLARTAKKVNILRLMGNVLSASISDPLRMLMVHGFRGNVDLFQTLLTDISRAKISRQQAKELGAGLELALSRSHVLADIADDFGGHSKFDRALDAAVNKFGRLNLMDPWNAILKQTAGALAVNRILKASEALMTGKISPKDLRRLAASGIDRETAEIIVEQVGKHGDIHGALRLANAGAWDDTPLVRQARMALEAAVRRDADRTVVTPGQDKPLWLSGTLGSVIGQFRTFQMVSIQRTLIAGLQERDAAFVAGLAGLIGMGIVSERLKMLVHGKEEKDGPKHIGDWMYAGLANSGALGWITDADQAVHKISGGNVSAAKLVFQNSRPISRFASQSIVGSTLGPTFGGATDAMKAINAGFTGKVTEADVHAMRRLLPYQNLMYISRALRAFEEGMVEKFNLPRTPTRN